MTGRPTILGMAIYEALPEVDPNVLKAALRTYTSNPAYLRSCAARGAVRIDLKGEPTGPAWAASASLTGPGSLPAPPSAPPGPPRRRAPPPHRRPAPTPPHFYKRGVGLRSGGRAQLNTYNLITLARHTPRIALFASKIRFNCAQSQTWQSQCSLAE